MAKRRCPITIDLLEEWEPPELVERFEDGQVRGADLNTKVCHAIAAALRDCERERKDIAAAMSAYLGETVTLHMLNAYASEAKTDHNISVARFAALIEATGDFRLLSILPDLFGRIVVEERFLSAIQEVLIREQMDKLAAKLETAQKQWKGRS